MILEQKRIYSKSWTRVLYHIFSSDTDIPRSILDAPGKLGDRYCRMIKEKFAGFNKEMDEITAAQRLERANSYSTTSPLPVKSPRNIFKFFYSRTIFCQISTMARQKYCSEKAFTFWYSTPSSMHLSKKALRKEPPPLVVQLYQIISNYQKPPWPSRRRTYILPFDFYLI